LKSVVDFCWVLKFSFYNRNDEEDGCVKLRMVAWRWFWWWWSAVVMIMVTDGYGGGYGEKRWKNRTLMMKSQKRTTVMKIVNDDDDDDGGKRRRWWCSPVPVKFVTGDGRLLQVMIMVEKAISRVEKVIFVWAWFTGPDPVWAYAWCISFTYAP
jgi:hypothetical protein